MRFRRFQIHILVLYMGLFTLSLVLGLTAINMEHTRNARTRVFNELEIEFGIFSKLIEDRSRHLIETAQLLSGDEAFKKAYSTKDSDAILSAIQNLQHRIDSDVTMLVSLKNQIVVDTLHKTVRQGEFLFPEFITSAKKSEYGGAVSAVFIDGQVYEMVVVPLLTPTPSAWVCIGFKIDNNLVKELQRLTMKDVSLFRIDNSGAWRIVASTLTPYASGELLARLGSVDWQEHKSVQLSIDGIDYITLVSTLNNDLNHHTVAVLQHSLDEALSPFTQLQVVLALLASCGLATSLLLGFLIVRRLIHPVRVLAENARRIVQGNYDYTQRIDIPQQDEIGDLANSFNYMVQELEERDRIRALLRQEKEFTANVNHELRTPLTTIKTSCELIAQAPGLSDASRTRLQYICNSTDRIVDLIQSLLMLARDPSSASYERMVLRECMEEAIEPFRNMAQEKSIEIHVLLDPQCVVYTNRHALYVALSNLIKNAVHYTERGTITVEYKTGSLSIKDSGRGISAEHLPYIFKRFYRAQADDSNSEGLGLGLAIVKHICDQHGWNIFVTSQLNHGTEFVLEF